MKNHPLRLALYWLLFVLALMFWTGFCAGHAFGQTPEDWKRLIRAQAGEFCSVVKRPPPQLLEAINQSAQQDARTWGPVVDWMNRIVTKYKEAGCGEA